MRKLATPFLVSAAHAPMGIGVAAADSDDSRKRQQKPDSIVTCRGAAGDYVVNNRTTPTSVTLDQCSAIDEDPCSPCIRSLENQGCKVVDVVVTNFDPRAQSPGSRTSFVLPREKP
jgi:hypothetical protein